MREFPEEVVGRGEPHDAEQVADAIRRVAAPLRLLVAIDRRRQCLEDRARRIERRVRILVDELDGAAERGEVVALLLPDVLPFIEQPSARRAEDAREHPAGGGLAAAALADDAERLAGSDRERDAVDRGDRSTGDLERAAHVVELDEGRAPDGRVDDAHAVAIFSATATSAVPTCSATVFQRMQRASWSGVSTGKSSGSRSAQAAIASGQRGMYVQPGGSRVRAGGEPGIEPTAPIAPDTRRRPGQQAA